MTNAWWKKVVHVGIGQKLYEFIGDLQMEGNRIRGLPDAVEDDEPVTKKQLDESPVTLSGEIGDLDDLDTTEKETIVGAINEINETANAALPSATIRTKKALQLNAHGSSAVKFKTATAAYIEGAAGPFDLSSPGDGGTIKLTVDAEVEATATLNAAAGNHVSGASPSTNMSAETDTKFKIAADGDATAHEVTCDWSGANSGALVAAAMQTAIRALGGIYAAITVAYTTVYTITSADKGTGSAIAITRATAGNCTEELKIGPDGGTSTAGTGDCASLKAVTRGELATLINGDISTVTATSSTVLTITSKTTGRASKVLAGNGTLNTAIGIPNTEVGYGAQGLGFSTDMADANYTVFTSLNGTASPAQKGLSINNRATTGFDIVSEGATDADYVDLLIIGTPAST